MDDTPVLNAIKKSLEKCRSRQIDLAHEIGITPQYMCDIINGNRCISEEIGAKFGYEKVWRNKKQ